MAQPKPVTEASVIRSLEDIERERKAKADKAAARRKRQDAKHPHNPVYWDTRYAR